MIDPSWAGSVQFYELVFGTWLAYGFLALLWDRALGCPLDEWKYVLITFFGAGAFVINHYFQQAPLYSQALNIYTIAFIAAYYFIAVHGQPRSVGWRVGATLTSIVFTIAYISFEWIARLLEARGIHEFWIMLVAYLGFTALIFWRGLRKIPESKDIR